MSPILFHHRTRNRLRSILLICAMLGVLGIAAELFLGEGAFLPVTIGVLLALLIPGRIQPGLLLRWQGAYRLSPANAPALSALLHRIAERAALARPPELYYLPVPALNAFALGSRQESAIVVSDGLLHTMTPREIAGIVAHEISHLRHSDLFVMRLAELTRRMMGLLATAGFLLLLLNLPLIALGSRPFPWPGVLLLMAGPTVVTLLQLALSRTREYDADLGAAELTGDPEGLAIALAKLERVQGGWLERMTRRGHYPRIPPALQTHPPTRERIRRLLALTPGRTPVVTEGEGRLTLDLTGITPNRSRWWR